MDAAQLREFILYKKRNLEDEKRKLRVEISKVDPDLNEDLSPRKSSTTVTFSATLNDEKISDDTNIDQCDRSALESDSKDSSLEVKRDENNLVCSSKTNRLTLPVELSKILRKLYNPEIGMLRTGEYSPNNPELIGDVRAQRGGDVFVGLGLYEEKRKKLLQKRQNEYKEYLAKQNQLNTLKKQKSNRLPPGRNLFLEGEKKSSYSDRDDWNKNINSYETRSRRPSSVGVQTDPEQLALVISDRKLNNTTVTQAERELSPRPSINDNMPSSDWRMHVEKVNIGTQNNLIVPPPIDVNKKSFMPNNDDDNDVDRAIEYNNYYDPFTDIGNNIFRKDSPRAKLLQDLRHTYMPSLFDAEAIKQRNIRIEEEAAAKRATYQVELKKQIEEQQRLREERKMREKLLEEAETRRLEEQLKMLKLSQENEIQKQNEIMIKMRNDANEFERQRLRLQNEIEAEKKNLRDIKVKSISDARMIEPVREVVREPALTRSSIPLHYGPPPPPPPPRHAHEPDSDLLSYNIRRNNPFVGQDLTRPKYSYSTNSSLTQSIPVNTYNSGDVSVKKHSENITRRPLKFRENNNESTYNKKPTYEPAFLNRRLTDMIEINPERKNGTSKLQPEQSSEAMKNLENKWKVPAVQKNILKNNFTEDGKQENILTQLGAIRRQLQLEQLKLDQSQIFTKQHKLIK